MTTGAVPQAVMHAQTVPLHPLCFTDDVYALDHELYFTFTRIVSFHRSGRGWSGLICPKNVLDVFFFHYYYYFV